MKVVIIGAGPGDPELITVKGRNVLEEAAVIIYAGSLVPKEMMEWNRKAEEIYDSSGMTLEEVGAVFMKHREEHGIIARLHTGDPSIYGAIQEQIDFCKDNDIPVEVIPGVSSFQAGAASMLQELTLPGITQTVILTRNSGRTPVPEREDLALLAKSKSSLILFLSISMADEVQRKLLSAYHRDTPVAVAYRVGWPEERILHTTLGEFPDLVKREKIQRQALIYISNVIRGYAGKRNSSPYERSKLYDPGFSHAWRKGQATDQD